MKPVVYASENLLIYFKTNFEEFVNHYQNNTTENIDELFENHNGYLTSNINFKYKRLYTSENSDLPSNERVRKNIEIIYNSLKHLTPVQAKDERLWLAMYHKYYMENIVDYVKSKSSNIVTSLTSELFFTHGVKRSLMTNGLARLWWIGYYLYDDSNKNPYHYLDFFTETQDITGKSTVYFSSNIVSNKAISFGVLSGIKEAINAGYISNTRKYYTEILKHLNIMGAVILLDTYSKKEIQEIVYEYFKENYS